MKVLKISYCAAMIMLMAWMIISWLEIGFHNCDPNPVYNSMNFFMVAKGFSV